MDKTKVSPRMVEKPQQVVANENENDKNDQ